VRAGDLCVPVRPTIARSRLLLFRSEHVTEPFRSVVYRGFGVIFFFLKFRIPIRLQNRFENVRKKRSKSCSGLVDVTLSKCNVTSQRFTKPPNVMLNLFRASTNPLIPVMVTISGVPTGYTTCTPYTLNILLKMHRYNTCTLNRFERKLFSFYRRSKKCSEQKPIMPGEKMKLEDWTRRSGSSEFERVVDYRTRNDDSSNLIETLNTGVRLQPPTADEGCWI